MITKRGEIGDITNVNPETLGLENKVLKKMFKGLSQGFVRNLDSFHI